MPLRPRGGFEPQFAGAVDVQVGDIAATEVGGKRREEGVEIDPLCNVHCAGPTREKSRSRATKMRTAAPCRVVMVGGMSELCEAWLAR